MICLYGAGDAEEAYLNARERGWCEGGDGDMAADVVVGGVGVHSAGSFSSGSFSTGVVTREGYLNGLEGGRGEVAHSGGRGGDSDGE